MKVLPYLAQTVTSVNIKHGRVLQKLELAGGRPCHIAHTQSFHRKYACYPIHATRVRTTATGARAPSTSLPLDRSILEWLQLSTAPLTEVKGELYAHYNHPVTHRPVSIIERSQWSMLWANSWRKRYLNKAPSYIQGMHWGVQRTSKSLYRTLFLR